MERWAPIASATGYEVSDMGRVRSPSGLVLRQRRDRDGYMLCDVGPRADKVTIKVHREVAKAFVGSPTAREVDHIDGRRDHNVASNLRWVTSAQNKLNRHAPTRASSGHRGVRYQEGKPRPWQAYFGVGRFKSLGYYATKDAAIEVRLNYEREFNASRA